MAKSKSGFGWNKIAGFLAFFALIITGVGFLLGLIGGDLGIVGVIGNYMLVGSVILSGWVYLNSTKLPFSKLFWTILFWVFAILAVLGVIGL